MRADPSPPALAMRPSHGACAAFVNRDIGSAAGVAAEVGTGETPQTWSSERDANNAYRTAVAFTIGGAPCPDRNISAWSLAVVIGAQVRARQRLPSRPCSRFRRGRPGGERRASPTRPSGTLAYVDESLIKTPKVPLGWTLWGLT
jgi:hypothetical protein